MATLIGDYILEPSYLYRLKEIITGSVDWNMPCWYLDRNGEIVQVTAAYRVLMMDSMKKPVAYLLPLMTVYETEDGEIII